MTYLLLTIIAFVLIVLVIQIYIITLIKKSKAKAKFNIDSFYLTIIIITIILSCIGCFFIGLRLSDIDVDKKNVICTNKDIVEKLISQQSITLAITTLCATLAGLVTTIISVFRDRKIQKDQNQIHSMEDNIKSFERNLKTISSVSALQMLEIKDTECYYDLICQYIDNTKSDNYSKLALLSLKAKILKDDLDQELSCFSEIIDISSKLITNSNDSIDKQFAILEQINALYKRARLNFYTSSSTEDLETARIRMTELKKYNSIDTFGHIANLQGLIDFWTAKINTKQEIDKRIDGFKNAEKNFKNSLEKQPQKVEYINHLGVTYINLYGLIKNDKDKDKYINKAKRTYNYLRSIDKNYSKAYTNYAHIYLDCFRNITKMNDSDGFRDKLSTKLDSNTIIEAEGYLKKAEKHLKKAIELAPKFIDNYYNYGALLTYRYFLKKQLNGNDHVDKAIEKQIMLYFNSADELKRGVTKVLMYKRNYYELINDFENYNIIVNQLSK